MARLNFKICKCGCNSHSRATGIDREGNKKYWFVCRKCGRSSQKYMGDNERQAILGWNKFLEETYEQVQGIRK